MELDPGQEGVVEHGAAAGPLRVLGGFGTGKTTALRRRADRLRREGRRPLLLHHRDLVDLAVAILGRHGPSVALAPPELRRSIVAGLVEHDVDEVAAAVVAFQASFLGDEELRVHADAAGCLDVAEELIAVTAAYLRILGERGLVDAGGALVQASLRLREPAVVAAERERFDELLVDDFQLASFASQRLLTQLTGPAGPLVVAGNADAAVSSDPLASAAHLDRFPRRFGAATIELVERHRRPSRPPELRLGVDDDEGSARRGLVVGRDDVEDVVGREAPLVHVVGACDGRWPAPRPTTRWFDLEVLHGPDVPDGPERDRRWRELERRRFLVATTRATDALIVHADPPVTPFLDELLR